MCSLSNRYPTIVAHICFVLGNITSNYLEISWFFNKRILGHEEKSSVLRLSMVHWSIYVLFLYVFLNCLAIHFFNFLVMMK